MTASLAARLSFGRFDLALVLLVEQATGSFAAAGIAIGLHGSPAWAGAEGNVAVERERRRHRGRPCV